MATAAQERDGFTRFARERLCPGDGVASRDRLFDSRRRENPADSDEDLAAIAGAREDFR